MNLYFLFPFLITVLAEPKIEQNYYSAVVIIHITFPEDIQNPKDIEDMVESFVINIERNWPMDKPLDLAVCMVGHFQRSGKPEYLILGRPTDRGQMKTFMNGSLYTNWDGPKYSLEDLKHCHYRMGSRFPKIDIYVQKNENLGLNEFNRTIPTTIQEKITKLKKKLKMEKNATDGIFIVGTHFHAKSEAEPWRGLMIDLSKPSDSRFESRPFAKDGRTSFNTTPMGDLLFSVAWDMISGFLATCDFTVTREETDLCCYNAYGECCRRSKRRGTLPENHTDFRYCLLGNDYRTPCNDSKCMAQCKIFLNVTQCDCQKGKMTYKYYKKKATPSTRIHLYQCEKLMSKDSCVCSTPDPNQPSSVLPLVLIIVPIVLLVVLFITAFLVYWFWWRKKKMKEEEDEIWAELIEMKMKSIEMKTKQGPKKKSIESLMKKETVHGKKGSEIPTKSIQTKEDSFHGKKSMVKKSTVQMSKKGMMKN